MAYRIRLIRYQVENINWTYYGAYRMRVEVAGTENIDPNIFVYQRGLVSPYTGQPEDIFAAIAGPAQLADIPALEPNANRSYPFFRLHYMEADFDSEAQALEVWQAILADARILCEAMGRFTQLQAVEDVWVPSVPDVVDSQSSESSQSL